MRAAGHYKNGADIGLSKFAFLNSVLVPYLLLIGSQLPLTVVYFRGLWQTRDHYRLFPFALLAVGFFIYSRWPRDEESPFFRSYLSGLLLCGGVVCGLIGTLLVTPWLAYVSLVAFAASLFARTTGGVAGSLLGLAVPLLILIQPPVEFGFDDVPGDFVVLTTIQTSGVALAGAVLDLLSTDVLQIVQIPEFVHNRDVTVIEFSEMIIDAEQLANGWRSTFSLLMVASILIAAANRTFVHGLLLLAATVLCGIFVLSLQLIAISFGHAWLQQDWQTGFSAQALETTLFLAGILMVYCSDQLLCFFLGPVDTSSIDDSTGYQAAIARGWNTILSGVPVVESDFEEHRAQRRHSRLSRATRLTLWALVPVLALSFLVQFIDLSRAAAIARRVPAEGVQFERIEAESVGELSGTAQVQFSKYDPHNADWSTTAPASWSVELTGNPSSPVISLDLDYPHPGWGRPIRRFARQGWDLQQQQLAAEAQNDVDSGGTWDYVEASFGQRYGQECRLFHCSFDASGRPIDRPLTWSTIDELGQYVRTRLANRLTARLLVPTIFQVQAYSITPTASSPEHVSHLRNLFLTARDALRETVGAAR